MDILDLSNWNVLIIDDEPDGLEVLSEALGMFDAQVHPASSGQEALTLLETLRPTVIISDLSMPGIDGYQLLYKIRRIAGLETVPVIALTAHAMAGDKDRILAAGFTGYISKPLRIGELISNVFDIVPSLKPTVAQGELK